MPTRPLSRLAILALAALTLTTVLVLPTVPAEAIPYETFADDFDPANWSGSDGSLPWPDPWQENGEFDGIDAGSIRIGNEPNCATDPCLLLGRDPGPTASATREVDLGSFATARLSFDYTVHTHPGNAGSVSLWINPDGGSTWNHLASWPLDTDESSSADIDITDHMGPRTTIRLTVYDNTDDSHMNVDNLVITAGRPVFYAIAGTGGGGAGDDLLTIVDPADANPASNEMSIGDGTGSSGIQAAAWHASTDTLFAVDGGQLGTVDTATGAFSARPSAIGTGNGSQGSVTMDDVVGIAFDPSTGDLYGAQRRSFTEALLIVIDPATGAIRTGVFGGDDYIQIQPDGLNLQVTDLAFDPTTGQAYVIHVSEVLRTFVLSTLDPSSGTTNGIGTVPDDLRSLDFDAAGRLWATTATGTAPEQLHELDKGSGASLSTVDLDNGAGYEALAIPGSAPSGPTGAATMVISEINTRGEDFVELYNADNVAVDIDGFVLAIDGDPNITIDQGGAPIIIPPGGHYLLAASGSPLPADQSFPFIGGLNSDVGFKLRDDGGVLLDEVGAGATSWGEGTTLPRMTSGPVQSYERLNTMGLGNCIDTDDNLADFVHNYGDNNPQNMSDPAIPCGSPTPASHVVISEFRPEGPAGEHDEFVEIFNPTGVSVDIGGWVFHITEPGLYRDYHTVPIGTTLEPGEHYLLSDDDGPLPNDWQPYDVATNYGLAYGDVVLKNEVGTIIDVLGYGPTSNGQLYETDTLPAYDGGTDDRSYLRRYGGYIDTDNNVDDFVYSFVASPQAGDPGPNRPPIFDQDLGNRSDAEGTFISVASPATDPDSGDTLTYGAVGLPEGISIDPGTGDVGGVLGPNSAGVHAVALTVIDDGTPNLSDTDSFSWTVTAAEPTYLVAAEGGGAGNGALLTAVDRTNADPATNEMTIGTGIGRTNAEGAAVQPASNELFASHRDQLGTIDVTTGVFTALPSLAGTGGGPAGLETFDNIEALSFHPATGDLYAIHRPGSGSTESLLLRLDPTTGAHVAGAFGGNDYVEVQNQGAHYQVPGMAHDPTDGTLYIIHWDDIAAHNWDLATLDPVTGATATIGSVPDDLTGLSFDEAGRLYGITDEISGGTVYQIDKTNGSVNSSINVDNTDEYEAIAIALPAAPNQPPAFEQDLIDRTDPEGAVISLSAAATDPDLHNLIYSATGLPPGLSVDPGAGLITGTIDHTAAATSPYSVTITVTDDGIPNLEATDMFIWTVSELNRPPVFDQDLLDRTDAEGTVISLSASATDPDAGDFVTYGVSGLPPGLLIDPFSGLISGTIDYTAAAGSPYAVTITATDDGLPPGSAVPDIFIWTVDNTNRPPVVVNPGPQTTPELAPFSLLITASDPDGTTPSFADGGTLPAWATLTDNGDGTATIDGTPGGGDSGTTTVTITASDGSLTDDAVFDLTVTNTNQSPTIDNPGDQFGAEGTPFSLVITASDPDGTTVGFSDGGTLPAWTTLTDNGDDTATITGTPSYTDAGVTTVTITASDGSLTDDAVFDLTVTNTNRAPVMDPVADQTVAEGTALTPLVVTASDPDGTTPSLAASGLPGWASFLDNGDGTATITGTPTYTDAAISTVTITASDGSLTNDAVFDLTVTNTNRAPVMNPVADQTVAEGDPLTPLVVTASDPDGTTPSLAASGLPGWASFLDNGDGTATITGTPTYTDAAIHTITINVEDGGIPNLSDTTNFDLTVTNTNRAPVMNPVADQTVAEGTALTPVTVTASDPDGTTPAITQTGLPGWASFLDNGDGTATITGTPGYTDAAISTVTITASDGSLTDDAVFDLTVTNTNRPPVAAGLPDRTDAEGATVSLASGGSDPDLDDISYSATGLPPGLTIDPASGLISGTIGYTASPGSPYTVEIKLLDDGTPALTATDSFTWTVTNTNRRPVFDGDLPDRTDPEGATVSVSAAATDPDLDTVTYSATGLPPGLTVDPASGLISGTISATAASTYSVAITATDDGIPALDAVDIFTWTVTNINRPPQLQPIANQLGPEETLISFTASASDPDLDGIVFSLSGQPTGATIDPATGVFTWTPAEAHGTGSFAVTVTATDTGTPALSNSKVVTITVTEVNRPPSISPIADQTDAVDSAITLVVEATDPDIPANGLVFSASGLPDGLAIDPATGVISGVAGPGSVGTHSVEITVDDGGTPAGVARVEFQWKVTDKNRPPIMHSIPDETVDEGDLIWFTTSGYDPDGHTLTFSLSGAPAGATIDRATGEFNWKPSEEQGPGTYRFTVVATDSGSPRLTASTQVTISVLEVNEPPEIGTIADQNSKVGDRVLVRVEAADPDLPANELTFSVNGLPEGLSINSRTGFITGVISDAAVGEHTITVEVTDNGSPAAEASTEFTWIVDDAEENDDDAEEVEPPAIDPIAEQYSEEGETVSLQIGASGSGPLSHTATGLPPGLSIDETSGLISGTIGEETAGTHHVTITVTESGPTGFSGTTTFFWIVTDVAAAEQKDDLVVALESFSDAGPDEPAAQEQGTRQIRRTLVVMGGVASATTEALSMPLALLLILLVGFVTMGRVGLYPLLWRGDRHRGTITFFDQEMHFGLIEPDGDGEAVFVHAHAFPRRQRATLHTGTRVRYRLLASDNRANAWGATTEGTDG